MHIEKDSQSNFRLIFSNSIKEPVPLSKYEFVELLNRMDEEIKAIKQRYGKIPSAEELFYKKPKKVTVKKKKR